MREAHTFILDEKVYLEAKTLAKLQGLSINRLVNELLARYADPDAAEVDDLFADSEDRFLALLEKKPVSGYWGPFTPRRFPKRQGTTTR